MAHAKSELLGVGETHLERREGRLASTWSTPTWGVCEESQHQWLGIRKRDRMLEVAVLSRLWFNTSLQINNRHSPALKPCVYLFPKHHSRQWGNISSDWVWSPGRCHAQWDHHAQSPHHKGIFPPPFKFLAVTDGDHAQGTSRFYFKTHQTST